MKKETAVYGLLAVATLFGEGIAACEVKRQEQKMPTAAVIFLREEPHETETSLIQEYSIADLPQSAIDQTQQVQAIVPNILCEK